MSDNESEERVDQLLELWLDEVSEEQFTKLVKDYNNVIVRLISKFALDASLPFSVLDEYRTMGNTLFVIAYHLGETRGA